jgi:hypothetical protein
MCSATNGVAVAPTSGGGGETTAKRRRRRPPYVEVEWWDAVDREFSGTIEAARQQGLARRFQAGYLVHQDERTTILAATYDPPEGKHPEQVENLTIIPTCCVIAIRGKRRRQAQQPASEPAKEEP